MIVSTEVSSCIGPQTLLSVYLCHPYIPPLVDFIHASNLRTFKRKYGSILRAWTVPSARQRQGEPCKICLTFSLRTRTYFVPGRIRASLLHIQLYSPTVVIVHILNSKQSGRHEDSMASELLGLTEFQSTS